MMTRTSAEFGDLTLEDLGEFGDRKRRRRHKKHHGFGNAAKKKLKRPYLRAVVRKGRKLGAKRKIGQVPANKSEFKWVTRGGGVYAAPVTKKRGGAKKTAKKAAKKGARKAKKSARKR